MASLEERPDTQSTYVFVTPPFTSGDAHIGHVRSYTIGDAYARYRRACGDAVLFSLGFDAFGLPAELAALEHGLSPAEWTKRCSERMCSQFGRLGISFEWDRCFLSSDPDIYRWSQWLFLHLYELGLVYQREGQVEWCKTCKTVLANLQVEDGLCWRCASPVKLVRRTQWYLRRSAYNEENSRNLEDMTRWNASALAAQRTILGCTRGVEFQAYGLDGTELTVFAPSAEAIAEGRFVLLSPNWEWIADWSRGPGVQERLTSLRHGGGQRGERKQSASAVIDTGLLVQVPTLKRPLPVLISLGVDDRVGPTVLLGTPSLNTIDAAIAAALGEPQSISWKPPKYELEMQPAVRYRSTDFSISRQRAWGAPIPVVHCDACGVVPVPVDELPVLLPDGLDFAGEGNPLRRDKVFRMCICPRCGGEARREADTLDCHIDAAWTELPLAVPREDRSKAIFEHPALRRWLPVAQLVQGADTGGFVLNMRLIAKALRDSEQLSFLADGEPFRGALMHEMVQMDGRKMSKHLGNVVTPDELVRRVGADALRLAVLYAAAPAKGFSWDEHALRYCVRFLDALWSFAAPRLEAARLLEAEIDVGERSRARLAMWCGVACEKVTSSMQALAMHLAARNCIRLFERIGEFERRTLTRGGGLAELDERAVVRALMLLVQLLSPLTPHIAEELWQLGGRAGLVCQAPWPSADAFAREHDHPEGATRVVSGV